MEGVVARAAERRLQPFGEHHLDLVGAAVGRVDVDLDALDRLFAGSLVSLVGMANGTFKSWRSSARYAVAATLVDAGVYLPFLAGPGLGVLPLRLRVEARPA